MMTKEAWIALVIGILLGFAIIGALVMYNMICGDSDHTDIGSVDEEDK